MNEKLTVTLPAETISAINQQVEAGHYASAGEVLRAAMGALAREEDEHAQRIAEIRAEIATSIADPRPSVPAKEAFERLHAYVDRIYSEK